MASTGRRLIVIGAGPIGFEAALLGCRAGFEVTVLEKERVGGSLYKIGSTRFFSPFSMNVSERVKALLGSEAPAGTELLTGEEMARRVLEPLSRRPPLEGRIKTGHKVVSVGRARMTRLEMAGHPLRAERPFKVLAESADGEEIAFEAEVVIDASGTFDNPRALGAGGVFARGERRLDRRIVRGLGALEALLPSLAKKRVLVAGHGHSAANALGLLVRREMGAKITWAVKTSNRRPCVEVASDPLPERREVVERANALAENPPAGLVVERRAQIESLEEDRSGALLVRMTGERSGTFDVVASFTGYRPDLSILSELELEVSPVSEGSMRIHRALANVTDCLSQPKLSAADLASGEPGFHLAGIKSYGRLPTFLLQNGIAQLEGIFGSL